MMLAQNDSVVGVLLLTILGAYYTNYQSSLRNNRAQDVGEVLANFPVINVFVFIWVSHIPKTDSIGSIARSIYNIINIIMTVILSVLLYTYQIETAREGTSLGGLENWAIIIISFFAVLTASSVIGSLSGVIHAISISGVNYIQNQEVYWTKTRLDLNTILMVSLEISVGISALSISVIQEINIFPTDFDLAYVFIISFSTVLIVLIKIYNKYHDENEADSQENPRNIKNNSRMKSVSNPTIKPPVGIKKPQDKDENSNQ